MFIVKEGDDLPSLDSMDADDDDDSSELTNVMMPPSVTLQVGFGRIVALRHPSATLCQIY
jgi:hypothetical protein